ncbi:MAG: translation elongation factor Ts, partial [Bacilli bacterium]
TSVSIKDNVATLIEVNSETDFVALNDEFKDLVTTILNTVVTNNSNSVEEALDSNVDNTTLSDLISEKTFKIGEKLSFRRMEKITAKDNEVLGSYMHKGGKISTLVVLNGGTVDIASDIAMHVAAMNPKYLNENSASPEDIENEKAILLEQIANEGKPANIAEKIVVGKMEKFLKENCLVKQPFVKNTDLTVEEFAKQNNATVVKFIRFEVGEGIEKKEENFAEEVQKQING